MNKGFAALLGAITVAFLGLIGGYVYAENAIEAGVEAAFANVVQVDGIDSASYQSIDVNLIGNTVTLTNVKSTYDVAKLLEATGSHVPPELKIDGKFSETFDVAILSGVRDVLFGATTLSSLKATGGEMTVKGEITAIAPKNAETSASKAQSDPNGMAYDVTITIEDFATTDLDIAPYLAKGTPAVEDYLAFSAKTLAMGGILAEGEFSPLTDAEGDQKGPMRLTYKIGALEGQDVTLRTYGPVTVKDIALNFFPAQAPDEGIALTASSAAITDTRFIDAVPVKIDYEINDLVISPGKAGGPKFQAGLAVIGIDEINMDMKVAYDIDPDSGDGRFGPVSINLKQAGRIDMTLDLAGLPGIDVLAKFQDDPESLDEAQLEAIVKEFAIKSASLAYSDSGILKKFIAAQAMQLTGGDIAVLADGFARQGAALVAASHGPEKAREVYEVLKPYLAAPGTIEVSLSTDAPVNVLGLTQAFALSGPQALSAFELSVTTPQ